MVSLSKLSIDELNKLMKLYEDTKKKEEEHLVLIYNLSQELISQFYKQFPPLKKVDRLIIQVSTISQWLKNNQVEDLTNHD